MTNSHRARAVAFYLPQYHPIAENDRWWGKGFTEWTNVSKAWPLFRGHYQPHVPADLGFYDLRVPETRAAQAELARDHGIEAFCYWHYWFEGKRLLELPFNEVLTSGQPNFPFCLAWANESWSGVWNGQPDKILIEQTYPGDDDYRRHFHAIAEALVDPRYLRVDGKPVFVVYRPEGLPDPQRFTDLWRELAIKAGLTGIHFVGILEKTWGAIAGFDAYTYHLPGTFIQSLPPRTLKRLTQQLQRRRSSRVFSRSSDKPLTVSYPQLVRAALRSIDFGPHHYPAVLPNWDSTPRHGSAGLVLTDSSPEDFRGHLQDAVSLVLDREIDHRLVFLKSWNEWAEGNYLEPDLRFGTAYLQVVKDVLFGDAKSIESTELAALSASELSLGHAV